MWGEKHAIFPRSGLCLCDSLGCPSPVSSTGKGTDRCWWSVFCRPGMAHVFHTTWRSSRSWVQKQLRLVGVTWLLKAGADGLQTLETWPWMVMPQDLFFLPVPAVPEDRSHNDHRRSSLAAWYVISSTKSPDRSQKAPLPPIVKQGRWGEAPGPSQLPLTDGRWRCGPGLTRTAGRWKGGGIQKEKLVENKDLKEQFVPKHLPCNGVIYKFWDFLFAAGQAGQWAGLWLLCSLEEACGPSSRAPASPGPDWL